MRQNLFEGVMLRQALQDPGLARLSWRINRPGDWVVQIYLDGRLHDVTHGAVRSVWLALERGAATVVELAAVQRDEAWIDQSAQLLGAAEGWRRAAHAAVVRDESLQVASRVRVVWDGEVVQEGRLWEAGDARGGFGGVFGQGLFGFDGATAPGHGLGEMGVGPFGSDGHAWRWRDADAPAGAHELVIQTVDALDRVTGATEAELVTIERPPPGAERVTVDGAGVVRWSIGSMI